MEIVGDQGLMVDCGGEVREACWRLEGAFRDLGKQDEAVRGSLDQSSLIRVNQRKQEVLNCGTLTFAGLAVVIQKGRDYVERTACDFSWVQVGDQGNQVLYGLHGDLLLEVWEGFAGDYELGEEAGGDVEVFWGSLRVFENLGGLGDPEGRVF